MADIKINILDAINGETHWHYEIMVDGKKFISGWYRFQIYDLFYSDRNLYNKLKPYIHREYNSDGLTNSQINKFKKDCVLITFQNSHIIRGVTKEIIDFITDKIKELYSFLYK